VPNFIHRQRPGRASDDHICGCPVAVGLQRLRTRAVLRDQERAHGDQRPDMVAGGRPGDVAAGVHAGARGKLGMASGHQAVLRHLAAQRPPDGDPGGAAILA
jgi:hypothetical protein